MRMLRSPHPPMTARMMRLWLPQQHGRRARCEPRLRSAVVRLQRRNDHAAGAIAALRGLLVDEGLLQWMQLVEGAEPLQRGDLVRTEVRDQDRAERTAAPLMSTAQAPHCARPQPNFRAIELEIVAQHVDRRRYGLGLDRTGRPLTVRLIAA